MTTYNMYGKVVLKDKDIRKGLMYRRERLKENEGMLFNMGSNKIHSMWMKNTYIPLDIIFLNLDLKVVGFVENTTPLSLKTITINNISRLIIETNSGFIKKTGLKINDYVTFRYYI